MGWLCGYGVFESIRDYADQEIKCGENFELLDRSVYGKEVYSLFHNKITGVRFIALHLITHEGNEWCRKDMDESCGPCYYNCPERILVQSNVTDKLAVEWRETCRRLRREKKQKTELVKALKAGDIIEYKGNNLKFIDYHNKSKSQIICFDIAEGCSYRYRVSEFGMDDLKPKSQNNNTDAA
jgi:hypothetical protein